MDNNRRLKNLYILFIELSAIIVCFLFLISNLNQQNDDDVWRQWGHLKLVGFIQQIGGLLTMWYTCQGVRPFLGVMC